MTAAGMILAVLAWTACLSAGPGGAPEPARPPEGRSADRVAAAIADVEWVLVRIERPGTSLEPRPGSRMTLRAQRDGRVSGTGGVNRYVSTLTASADGRLHWASLLGSTQMAGPVELMEQEGAFLLALAHTARWHVSGAGLVLESEDGAVRLLFRR